LPYEEILSLGRMGKPLCIVMISTVLEERLEGLGKTSQKLQVLFRIWALPQVPEKTNGADRLLIARKGQAEKRLIRPDGVRLAAIPRRPILISLEQRTFFLEHSLDDVFTRGDTGFFRAWPGVFKHDLAAFIEKHEPDKTRRDFFADDLE